MAGLKPGLYTLRERRNEDTAKNTNKTAMATATAMSQ